MIHLLIAAAATLTLHEPPTEAPVGLLHVHHYHAHWYSINRSKGYEYQLPNGQTWTTGKKLKGLKDLRPYEEAHPRRYWVQQFATRWQPVASLGTTAAAGLAASRLRTH